MKWLQLNDLTDQVARVTARLDRHLNAAEALERERQRLTEAHREFEKFRELRRDVLTRRWELRQLIRHLRAAVTAATQDHNRHQFSVAKWSPILSNDLCSVRRLVTDLKDRSPRYSTISGIYMLVEENEIVYIGQAINVHERIATHCREGKKKFSRACVIPTPPHLLNQREQQLIRIVQPMHNRTFKVAEIQALESFR